MFGRRFVIDYALARRSVLADVYAGRVSAIEVCDAHPYLLRAARYHGEKTARSCPVCRRSDLWQVNWVYGDALGSVSGSARSTAQVAAMAGDFAEFTVYVVEVCRGCSWNHLVTSYVVGEAGVRTAQRRAVARRGSAAD